MMETVNFYNIFPLRLASIFRSIKIIKLERNGVMQFSPHHKPCIPTELQLLTQLRSRMTLSQKEELNFNNLHKGFIGEKIFYDRLATSLSIDYILLNGLLLQSNQTEFQIDHLLICQNTLYLFEVKNYEGDFYIQDNKWYAATSEKEIRNPLLQLERSEFFLRSFLQPLRVSLEIKPYIVFVNPEFMLYHAPMHQSIIYPAQINRFIQKLNATPSALMKKHERLANHLVSSHLTTSAYEKLPEYDYHQLKKGITCKHCLKFLSSYSQMNLYCTICDRFETNESAVLRNVQVFNLLFPNEKITTKIIYDWCGKLISQKIIRRILQKNLHFKYNGRYSYYVIK